MLLYNWNNIIYKNKCLFCCYFVFLSITGNVLLCKYALRNLP